MTVDNEEMNAKMRKYSYKNKNFGGVARILHVVVAHNLQQHWVQSASPAHMLSPSAL